jgi:hypothetical protein
MAPPRSDHKLRDLDVLSIEHKLGSGSEVIRVFGIKVGMWGFFELGGICKILKECFWLVLMFLRVFADSDD